jgi:hypothetical protein
MCTCNNSNSTLLILPGSSHASVPRYSTSQRPGSMVTKDLVFCMCCNKHITRRRERAHRSRAHKLPTTPTPRKRPRLAFKAAHTPRDKSGLKIMPTPTHEALDQDTQTADPGPDMFFADIDFAGPSTSNDNSHHVEGDGQEDDTDQILTSCMSQRWTKCPNPSRPQSEPDEDLDKLEQDAGAGDDSNASHIPLEDGLSSDESDTFDWDESDQQYGSIIRDELGDEFESRYAMIGASHSVYPQVLIKLTTFLAAIS